MNIKSGKFLCVQCGTRNESILRFFTKNALTLQTCVNCNQIVDKYVEYDFTTILIDLILLKISAYRHMLYNTISKTYLPRLVALTLLSCSYVEWVYEKGKTENRNEPTFYELEWGYYIIIFHQCLRTVSFAVTFLFFGFLSSKSLSIYEEHFSCLILIQGLAMSYCWNLVTIWSLVWNHYYTYYVLSQIALLISCNHTFHVCLHPSYLFSVVTIGCAYGIQLSIAQWLKLCHCALSIHLALAIYLLRRLYHSEFKNIYIY